MSKAVKTKKEILEALSEIVGISVSDIVLLDSFGELVDVLDVCASLQSAIEKEVWYQLTLPYENSLKSASTTLDHV